MNLDDLDSMRAVAPDNFRQDVDDLPDQLAQGWALAQGLTLPGGWGEARQVVLAGMGASAMAGALAQAYAAEASQRPSGEKVGPFSLNGVCRKGRA